jgi:hypothetical protein
MRTDVALLVLVLLLSQAAGCAALRELFRNPDDRIARHSEPDPLYEELVDHYVELCAVSQFRPLEGRIGGTPGHAVMYLKGACRDESAAYPRLRPCRYATGDTEDPEHGAGISVNRWFKNVNWVATPGRFLFYNGEVETYDVLDRARFDQAAQRAIDLGLYRGVELHPIRDAPEPPELREFVDRHSLGTDFALRFGRTVYCARLPMPEEMLAKTMDYLNSLNEEYWKGEADYEWSGYADNCVHTLHNALAAAGIWERKSVRATKLRQMYNIAVPANTMVDLAFLSNKYPIEDFSRIQGDALRWNGLTQHHWLPAVPGALMLTLPVLQLNEVFDTRYRMFVLAGWFSNDTLKRAQHLLNDGRYLQVDANLRYFYDRYNAILAERDEAETWTDVVRSKRFLANRRVYYEYIESARDGVLATARKLRELQALRRELTSQAFEQWERRVRSTREGQAPPAH